jgi:hypothetical protein
MARFKEPDFKERQKAAAQAEKAAMENFRAKAADPAAAEPRLIARRRSPPAGTGPFPTRLVPFENEGGPFWDQVGVRHILAGEHPRDDQEYDDDAHNEHPVAVVLPP